jgi:hypothetical protein
MAGSVSLVTRISRGLSRLKGQEQPVQPLLIFECYSHKLQAGTGFSGRPAAPP